VLIAVFGVVPEPNHSLDDLLHLLARPAFVVFASVLGVTVVGVLVNVSPMRNCCIALYLQATG
jgi:hypothetical protein